MRMIVDIKLTNGTIMTVVGDVANKEAAKMYAVQMSPRMFAMKELHVTNNNAIVNCDTWAQDKKASYQHGYKQFLAAFMLNGILQFMKVEAPSIKGVYNNIKINYGIQESIIMLIYEVNQRVNKRSAMYDSRIIVKDNAKLFDILNKAIAKIRQTPEINVSMQAVMAMVSLLKDYKSRKYTEIEPEKLIAFVASILYFLKPEEYNFDLNSNTIPMDACTALYWLVGQLDLDIKKYCSKSFGENDTGNMLIV